MAGRQTMGIGVIADIRDTLEPAAVKLTEHAGNIGLQCRRDINRIAIIGLNVVVHGTKVADGVQHHATDHEGNHNQ